MNFDLFSSVVKDNTVATQIAAQAWHLVGFAEEQGLQIRNLLSSIIEQAPFRQMKTPGGQVMSVKMTSCGDVGWVSDHLGYRYQSFDPVSGLPWPAMPEEFKRLAEDAAAAAGFASFNPDSCLINLYQIGTRLSLHQDKDEVDDTQPIVSVSLGLPATFLWGGLHRSSPQTRVGLRHGDVVVWGGESRFFYHGVLPLEFGQHDLFAKHRVNLTFRKAL
ncbi:MAG: alkylated DNA repair protein (DNA oxidative demethylase) [Oleispira sp.]